MNEYVVHQARYTENYQYEKAHNRSSVYDIDLKFLQELDNFMSYNFSSQCKVIIPENASRKIQLLLLWFSVFSENRASVFCEYLLLYMSD